MALALQTAEKEVIFAALAFANLRATNSREGTRCFNRVIDFHDFLIPASPRSKPSMSVEMDDSDLAKIQLILKDWLHHIVKDKKGKDRIAKEIADLLPEHVTKVVKFDEERRQLHSRYAVESIPAACALAAALLLQKQKRVKNPLKQCGWSECGRFSLTDASKGRPRRFCNDEHKKRYDVETGAGRVRKHREHQRALELKRELERKRKGKQ